MFKSLLCMALCSLISISFCACNIKSGSTELFSEEVLQEFDIPWLIEPQSCTDIVQKKNSSSYEFTSYMESESDFYDYINHFYNELIERNYVVANYYKQFSQGDIFNFEVYFHIGFTNEYSYIITKSDDRVIYRIYYTAELLGDYNSEIKGRIVSNVNIIDFIWGNQINENGLHYMEISVQKAYSGTNNYFLNEIPEAEE